jgi:UDP-N-acetylmuramate-alanine ligase
MSRFDINEKPWRKDSFLFTDAEFDRLEDFKLELRRRFDVKVTKNDIARAAFQCLYEDYTHDPRRSAIVRHLRSKKT